MFLNLIIYYRAGFELGVVSLVFASKSIGRLTVFRFFFFLITSHYYPGQ